MAEWLDILESNLASLAASPVLKALLALALNLSLCLFGLPDKAVEALLWLISFDYALGAAHAWKKNELSFYRAVRGIGKFVVYGFALQIVTLTDQGVGVSIYGVTLRNLLCGYLCAHEALSALTHLEAFGFPMPEWLKTRLRHYRDSCFKSQSNVMPSGGPSGGAR